MRRRDRPATAGISSNPPRAMTLDAGALIAIENRDRRVWATLELARRDDWQILIPAGVLGQVWRNPARQAVLASFLKWRQVSIKPLTADVARAAGILCGMTDTRDVIDASVALCARQSGGRVLTSDPEDLRRLLPLTIIEVT